MKKRLLNWLLALCMAVTLLPAQTLAAEGNDPPQQMVEEPACTCGAAPGEDGLTAHQPECPLYEQPQLPAPEPEPVPLTAPDISAAAYDEETGSMVLTVAGDWDTYAWEACTYGWWTPWEGDGCALLLEKGDFVSHGFRCTVTKGEQSVTSEVYAYDAAVLEFPEMSLAAAGDGLSKEGDYMRYAPASRYNRRFDIFGRDGRDDIRTTYDGSGYRTVIQVDGSSTKTEVRYREGATSAENSLTAETFLEIDSSGRYVKVTYCVTNNGSTSQTFKIGTEADVMIGANDRARVSRTSNGLKMEGSWLGFDLLNAYDFYLIAPTCDTLWYGYYADSYLNIFQDRNDGETYGKDSGMAWSWTGTVDPGETWERYVLIGAGKIPDGPEAPTLAQNLPELIPGRDTAITGTAEPGSTVHVNVDGEEYTTTADESGNFSVDVTLPEDFEQEETTIQAWAVGEGGGVSDVTESTVGVIPLPQMVLTTDAVSIMEDETIGDSWYDTYIDQNESRGTITYSETVMTDMPGIYEVTYTAAVEELPAEISTDTATLTVTVLPQPAALSRTEVKEDGETRYTLTANMTYTGGKSWTETGFVYGVIQNPTLALCDGSVATDDTIVGKGGTLIASVSADDLTYGITYYARAYAKASDDTVIYGAQSEAFGLDIPDYGTFSVKNNGDHTFTITRTGSAGTQTVYYRTVNGSAVGGTHFTHKAGTLVFDEGETEKTVTITGENAAAQYEGYTATAYSNAQRVYFLEIYRVTGGATIDTDHDKAMRTMDAVDTAHQIDRDIYNIPEVNGDVTGGTGKLIRDREEDQGAKDNSVNFTDNNRDGVLNWSRQVSVENLYDAETAAYLAATDGYWLYRFAMTAQGTESKGRQDMWFGYQSPPTGDQTLSGATTAKVFDGQIWYGIYTLTDTGGQTAGKRPTILGNTGLISPVGGEQDSYTTVAPNDTEEVNDRILPYGGYNYGKLSADEDAYIHFSAHGDGVDDWYILRYQEASVLRDDNEPDLIGIAPMADGVYQPGDEITIALIFDEIVDEQNSTAAGLNASTAVSTNWGSFQYEGGLGTNVIYCTGIVPDDASETITIDSAAEDLQNGILGKVRDMCSGNASDTVTAPDGIQTTIELSNDSNAPTAMAGDINNDNGTLTATVSGTNAAKLEYAWSDQDNPENVVGWNTVAASETTTVTAARTEGTWYLHVRATSGNGLTDYDMKSITLAEGAVTVPTITVSVDNTGWAKEREITISRYPADAAVSVSGPAGDAELGTGTTYTAIAEGLYTFTMTVDGEVYSAFAAVEDLDRTSPAVEIVGPAETTHIEPVTLTVQASDGQSGVASVTGTWSDGTTTLDATLELNGNTWTTTSPNRGGEWSLTVVAEDAVGNRTEKSSQKYTVSLTVPTVIINGPTETEDGYQYTYTVTENGMAIASIELPGGTILEPGDEGFALTGTFILTEPGTYTVSVTDSVGHVVTETVTLAEDPSEPVDFTSPEVRLSLETDKDNGTVTAILVSVYEKGGLAEPYTFTWKRTEQTEEYRGDLAADSEAQGAYEGSITPVWNGTYSVTVTDAAGHATTTEITVAGNDETAPKYHSSSVEAGRWYSDEMDVELRFQDEGVGLAPLSNVKYAVLPAGQEPAESDWRTPSGSWADLTGTGDFPDGVKALTVSGIATGQWTVWYQVPDEMGNTLQGSFGPVWVDTTQPTITVNIQAEEAGALTANVTTSSDAISGVTVTVSKQGQPDSMDITDGTYAITEPGTYTFTAATGAGKTATKTITVYQVSVDDGTGSSETQLVQENAQVQAPEEPTRPGYIFTEWQDGTGQTVNFPVTVTPGTDTNFTAVWTLKAPTVDITGTLTGIYNDGKPVVTLTADVKHDAAGLEYTCQWYKEGVTAAVGAGQTLELSTVADSGSYTVTVTASDGTLTSQAVTSAPVDVAISKATPSAPEDGTGYVIDFDDETIRIDDGYEIYTGTEVGAKPITDGSITDYLGETIYIRTEGDENNEPSGWTEITIPARPEKPGSTVSVTGETVRDKGDGTAEIPAEMEYLVVEPGGEDPGSEEDWDNAQSGPAELENLEAGTKIVVRVQATENTPHGQEQTYTVSASSNTLTVTFDSTGGSDVAADTGIPYKGTASEPDAPTRAGYSFVQWQLEGEPFDFHSPIKDNITLTAVWSLNKPVSAEITGAPAEAVPYGTSVVLTAGASHAAGMGISYTYQWYRAGEPDTPLDGETQATLTLKNVADSGSYYVEVRAFDGAQTSGESLTSEPVTVEIVPKPIAVGWTGRNQVYDGTAKAIIAQAAGLVGEDTCTVTLTYTDERGNPVAAPTAAGTYTATAQAENPNYTIFNDTQTLTIEPAPVTFAVTENVKVFQEGVGTFAAKVTPDTAGMSDTDYIITYRNSQGQVTQPKEEGIYTIWAEITNPNYRHAGAADGESRQIGILTVVQAEPAKYTVTFDGGEAAGQGPADFENVPAGTVLLLPDAGTLTKPGYAFDGWVWNGTVYRSGDAFTMPAGNVVFTARWQAVYTASGVVQNTDEEPLEDVTVTLMRGAEVIATDTTKNGGAFSFSEIPGGLYNLVAQYRGITVTAKVDLEHADSTDNTITMPGGMTNSIVTVVGDTPVAVVGNLDTVFTETAEEANAVYTKQDMETVKNGGIVEVELTAATPDTRAQEAIEEALQNSPVVNQSANLGLFLDLTVEKTVIAADDASPTDSVKIHDTGVILDTHILLPQELQGKDHYVVYRIHTTGEGEEKQTEIQTLTVGGAADGERLELNADKTVLTIHARYYSDYVLAWWDTPSGSGGSPVYPPAVTETDHGTVVVSPTRPSQGQTVTVTVTPDEGYEVDRVIVTDQNGGAVAVIENPDGTYQFTQPSDSVTVTVTFRKVGSAFSCPRDETCPMYGYLDLDLSAWYHDGVHYCLDNGLMVGTDEAAFSPEGTTTRGQSVTILWRLAGSPVVDYLMDFSDVDPAAYYGEAIRWATSEGIASGYGGGLFGPDDPITREQFATMLWRFAQEQGYDVSIGEDTNILSYTDAADLSEYAIPAMQWAVGAGIISGTGDGSTLTPQGEATRAQAAVMLMQFGKLDK